MAANQERRRHTRRQIIFLSAIAAIAACSTPSQAENTWTGTAADFKWKTPTNWSAGLPSTTDTARFAGSSIGVIQLEGFTRTIAALHFANSFPSSPYTITNGTLVLNQITNDGYVGSPGNTISAAVISPSGGTSPLSLISNAGYLEMTGPVTAGALSLSGGGVIDLSNSSNSFSSINITDNATVFATNAGSLSTAPISIGSSILYLRAPSAATFNNNLTVAAGAFPTIDAYATDGSGAAISLATLRIGNNSYLDYETEGTGTLAFSSAILQGGSSNFTTSAVQGTLKLGAVSEAVAGSAISAVSARIVLTAAGSYTGGTNIYGDSIVTASSSGALGSGAINVFADGVLQLNTPQSLPTTTISSFGALIGTLDGAHYSGGSQNIFLSTNSILGVQSGPSPVRGVDVTGAPYYLALTSSTQIANVGDDNATSIYNGVALGAFTANSLFHGTVSENVAGQGISVYTSTDHNTITLDAGNTFNSTAAVTFTGHGDIYFAAPPAGTAKIFTFSGAGDATSQADYLAELSASAIVSSTKTLNLSNGILVLHSPTAVSNGGNLNVSTGGTLLITNALGTVNPSSGNYNILPGGALFLDGTTSSLGSGATFTFSTGSLLILSTGSNTGSGTGWIPTNANIILDPFSSSVTLTGAGLTLGNGRRLTTTAYADATLSGGAGVKAASGAAIVLFTAGSGDTLRVNDNISLPSTDLQIGDAGSFTTITDGTVRQSVTQDGTVILGGATNTVGNLTVAAGTLSINSKMIYGSTTTLAVSTGATLTFNVASQPAIPTGGVTLSVASGASVTASGSVDPFTDSTVSRSMTLQNAGTVIIASGIKFLGTITGTGALLVGQSAAATTLSTPSIAQASLTIDSNSKLALTSSSAASKINSLSITTGGKLDLAAGTLVIDYTGSTVISTIRTALFTGRAGGAWTGAGIDSSTAAADSAKRTAIAYAEASGLYGLTGTQTATVKGQTVDATSLILKYTWYGDANMDGVVNADDYALIDRGLAKHLTGWTNGDFNYDNVIDSNDFMLADRAFAFQSGQLDPTFLASRQAEFGDAYVSSLIASVPEPSVSLLLAASIGLRRRRR